MKLIALAVVMSTLSGCCNYKLMTGEEGFEYGFTYKPITQAESQEKRVFEPRKLTLGFSRHEEEK